MSRGNRHQYYILDGHKAVPVTMMEWARWLEDIDNRSVAVTLFPNVEPWLSVDLEERRQLEEFRAKNMTSHEKANEFDLHEQVSLIMVSTVFIGLDHNWSDRGPPYIFESLVFNGPLDGEGQRYSTWDDAEQGHNGLVRKVKDALVAGQRVQMPT